MKGLKLALCVALLSAGLTLVSAQLTEAFSARVSTDALNVRSAPNTSSQIVDVLMRGQSVSVVDTVAGEPVLGDSTWYLLDTGGYVYAAYVSEGGGFGGGGGSGKRWIDVDLSAQTATAYVGDEPVYTALVTTGVNGQTPVGNWYIFSRVYNETMDSSTIGIPSDGPGGWYLENVYFTQYFAPGGFALHYNYWADRSVFGNRPSSAGCVGMEYEDAAFFWDFADYGTLVRVHY